MAEENGKNPAANDVNQDVKSETHTPKQNGNAGGGGGGGSAKKRGKDDVCRDFLNGICNRGGRCRFRHPESEETPGTQSSIVPYTFCIDFQNKGCFRESCRFIHASSEDAERYQRKGIVSLPLARAIAATLTINDSINGIPICKEFQTGACSRGGNRCRYWHVNIDEEKNNRASMVRMGQGMPPAYMPTPGMGMRRPAAALDYEYDHIPAKRAYPGRMPPPHPMAMGMEPPPSAYISSLERRNAELEKENEALRREVEREKSRYEDLMAVFKGQQHHSGHAPAPVPAPHSGHAPPMPQHPQYPPQHSQYPGYHDQHHPSWS